jgi:hypothetical protein
MLDLRKLVQRIRSNAEWDSIKFLALWAGAPAITILSGLFTKARHLPVDWIGLGILLFLVLLATFVVWLMIPPKKQKDDTTIVREFLRLSFSDLVQERNKTFVNQTVEMDGKAFINCVFDHTTLKYEGKASFSLVGCTFAAHANRFSSGDQSIIGSLQIMKSIGMFKDIPFLNAETGSAIVDIEPEER